MTNTETNTAPQVQFENSEDFGMIMHAADDCGEIRIYRTDDGCTLETWEDPEPWIGHFGRWVAADPDDGDNVEGILAAFHNRSRN